MQLLVELFLIFASFVIQGMLVVVLVGALLFLWDTAMEFGTAQGREHRRLVRETKIRQPKEES